MKFTPEQLAKAKTCKSVEVLLSYANEIGYPLTEEQAKKQFEAWNKEGELADEELNNVAGGSQMSGCSVSTNGTLHESYLVTDYPPHYVIVSATDSCAGWSDNDSLKLMPPNPGLKGGGTCGTCVHFESSGGDTFCKIRTHGNDPYYQ